APPPSPGTPCSPPASGTCSVILPHGVGGLGGLDQVGSFVIADHTDVVVSGDAPTLFDDASAKGVDLDAMVPPAPFTVDTPGMIKVNVPPTPVGCRITGGGTVNGVLDPNVMAEITKAQFAGQVGAPCGCFGCFDKFDPKLASVQGNWTHQRKNK